MLVNGCATGATTTAVVDNVKPTFTMCPSGTISVFSDTNSCSALATYGTSANDNCAVASFAFSKTGATTATGTGNGSGSRYNVGTTNVAVTVTDTASNVVATPCTFAVNVIDNVAPTFAACPSGLVRRLNDPGLCGAFVSYQVFPVNNCGGAVTTSYMLSGATNSAGTGTGSTSAFNIGLTNVVVTAFDDKGNMATCAFVVEVIDASLSLSCPSNRTVCAGSSLT